MQNQRDYDMSQPQYMQSTMLLSDVLNYEIFNKWETAPVNTKVKIFYKLNYITENLELVKRYNLNDDTDN